MYICMLVCKYGKLVWMYVCKFVCMLVWMYVCKYGSMVSKLVSMYVCMHVSK